MTTARKLSNTRLLRTLLVVSAAGSLAFLAGCSRGGSDLSTATTTTYTEEVTEVTEVTEPVSPMLESARAFDRSLTTLASFGVEEDLSFVDPRQGPNVIQMLGGLADPLLELEEVPDSGVETVSLTRNSLRVLMWNPSTSSWVRLCIHTGCVVSLESVGTGAGKIPLGSTPSALTTEPFCFAFHADGLTAYLGASELANAKGVVSESLGEACGEMVTSPPTGVYHLLGNTEPVTDSSW